MNKNKKDTRSKASKWRKDSFQAMQRITKKDRWENTYSGFGGAKSVISRTSFGANEILAREDIENMHRFDWLTRKIIHTYPEDALREGITIDLGDKKLESATSKFIEEIGLEDKLAEAEGLARMYGGSVIVIGALDGGELAKELNTDNISQLAFMTVLDRWQIEPRTYYTDVFSTKYGMPETYTLQPIEHQNNLDNKTGLLIHETRLIRFDGNYLPDRVRRTNQYWHDSILIGVNDTLKLYGISLETGATLMNDFVTKVLKMPNLQQLLMAGNEDALTTRIQFALSNMSSSGMALVGADEEFSKVQTPVAGLPEMTNIYIDYVAAAADIPRTRLFGQQLGTLSGADETTRNYYDSLKAYQKKKIRRPYERILSLIFKNKSFATGGNEPDEWSFKFNPMWQLSETEEVANRLTQSNIDVSYLDRDVYSADEVRQNRFGADGYSLEMDLDDREDPNIEPAKGLTEKDLEENKE